MALYLYWGMEFEIFQKILSQVLGKFQIVSQITHETFCIVRFLILIVFMHYYVLIDKGKIIFLKGKLIKVFK